MREHDNSKGRHDNAVHDHGHILRDGENVARADAAGVMHHLPAAEIDNEQYRDVQQQCCQRQQRAHGDVAADDVFGHDVRGLGDALVLMRFGIECADDADAAQTLAHDAVLLVDVQVGFLPKREHALACKPAAQQNDRHKGQQNQRQRDVLGHGQRDAADKEHRDGRHGAAEHGRDPRNGFNVMRCARNEGSRAELTELLKGERVDLAENVCAQVAAEVRHDARGGLGAAENADQTGRCDRKHGKAGTQNGGKLARSNAAVENARH